MINKVMLAILGLTFTLTANAAIQDFGRITGDTVSALAWLDVTETVGLSYNEVVAQLGLGGAYEGWRYATTTELDQLITDWGYQPTNLNCNFGLTNCDTGLTVESELAETMIRTLGDTTAAYLGTGGIHVSPDGAGDTTGLLGDTPRGTGLAGLARINDGELVYSDGSPAYNNADAVYPASGWAYYDSGYVNAGSFLVRPLSGVPLPPAAGLYLLSIATVLIQRRRKAPGQFT